MATTPESSGRVAVVSGAGSGIGRAVARLMLAEGYRVVLAGRRELALQETAAGHAQAVVVPCDVTAPDDVERLFAAAFQRWGRVDVLFNNAGVFGPSASVDEISLLAWDATARPSPVTSSRAAQGAVTERCDVMLLDCGSGHERLLRPSMVWALAQQRGWLPAHADPFVAQALLRATADEEDVVTCSAEADPAGAGMLRVVLSLRAGLDAVQVQSLATRIGERIAADGEARARIDGLSFTIRQA